MSDLVYAYGAGGDGASGNESALADAEDRELVDELLQANAMDCSLSCPEFSVSDWALGNDSSMEGEASPSTSSSDCASTINFHDVWQGINTFLDSAESDTIPDIASLIQPTPIEGKSTDEGVKSIKKTCSKIKKKQNEIRKGQRYMPNFKRKVLNYAVKHTFRETADKFKINCNTLTEWAREYKRLLQLKKSTTSRPGSTLKTDVSCNLATTDETDALTQRLSQVSGDVKFIQWLRSKRLQGTRVWREEVQTAGLALLQPSGDGADWFTSWVRRINATAVNSVVPQHIFYPNGFKLEVALYAKEYTKKAAAETFSVSSRRLYEWCDRQDDLTDPEASVAATAGAARRHVESQLLLWFNKQCAAGARPKSHELMSEARNLYAASGLPHVKCSHGWLERIRKRLDLKLSHGDDDALLLWVLSQLDDNQSLSVLQVTSKAQQLAAKNQASFKGSKGWTLRFLKRHSHVLQCSSARISDLPQPAVSLVNTFCRQVQQRVGAAGLSAENVGSMDEIPITFIYPTEKVQTPRLLRKAGLETAHAVVLLATTSDGRLLPPAVVFKGRRAMQTFKDDNVSIPVLYHADGGVDANILIEWSQHIWLRLVSAPSVLVVDSFAPHQDSLLGEALSAGCCHLAVIPAGCAVHLQPCAFNLSRRFQEAIQDDWLKYTADSSVPAWRSNKTGPDEGAILSWVANAYFVLRDDTYSIRSSFHLAGLTKPTCSGAQSDDGP